MDKKLKKDLIQISLKICRILSHFKIMPDILKLFVGNFSSVMATLNLTLCVLYYNWIFLIVARRPQPQISVVSTLSSGPMKIISVRSVALK